MTVQMSPRAQLDRGLDVIGVSYRFFVLPVSLDVIATLSRVVALTMFIPLIWGLLTPDAGVRGRFGRLLTLLDLPQEFPIFPVMSVGIFVLTIIGGAFAYAAHRLVVRRVGEAEAQLAQQLMQRYLELGQAFLDDNTINRLANRLRRISRGVARLLNFLHRLGKAVSSVAIYFVAMALLAWPLALAALVVLVLYFLAFGRLTAKLEEKDNRALEADDAVRADAQDILINAALVRLMSTQRSESERLRQRLGVAAKRRLEHQSLAQILGPAQDIAGILILLSFVAIFVAASPVEASSNIVVYLIFFLIFRRAISQFSFVLRSPGDWQAVKRNLDHYLEIMSDEGRDLVISGSREDPALKRSMALRDLRFAYARNRWALDHISLEIQARETTAVVGANGSGKTTLLRLLKRDYEYQSGSIELDGVGVREFDVESLRGWLFFMGRDPLLLNDTIRANMAYGLPEVENGAIWEALRHTDCEDFVREQPAGLDTEVVDLGNRLSNGERQRLGLARVFLGPPPGLILLDEAMSSLDSVAAGHIIRALRRIPDATLLMVVHGLSIIEQDMHVIVLDKGHVAEQGPRDELLKEDGGRFREMWISQNLSLPA